MLVLVGKVRQIGDVKTKDGKELKKIWLEHESPGWDEGVLDLKIEEFMLGKDDVPATLKEGQEARVEVRAYAKGRDIAYKAISLLGGSFMGSKPAAQGAAS
jgi:hypothetical protein